MLLVLSCSVSTKIVFIKLEDGKAIKPDEATIAQVFVLFCFVLFCLSLLPGTLDQVMVLVSLLLSPLHRNTQR